MKLVVRRELEKRLKQQSSKIVSEMASGNNCIKYEDFSNYIKTAHFDYLSNFKHYKDLGGSITLFFDRLGNLEKALK